MNDRETNELLVRIRNGEEAAFSELYNRWSKRIYQFAWQMTGSPATAEDITQDVFLLIIRNKLRYDPVKGNFSSFIYGVARNLAWKAANKERAYADLPEIEETDHVTGNPLVELTSSETTALVRKCILSLPAQFREVVVLCDLHEMSYAEAAEVTGTVIGTIRSRLHRGRELLLLKLRAAHKPDKTSATGGTAYEISAL